MAEHMEEMMLDLQRRKDTFKTWPIQDEPGCVCTIQKMADAGFYQCGGEEELDLTRCFCCQKEMEGWEAEDVPSEARYHKKNCMIPKLNKPTSEFTTGDMFKIVNVIQAERIRARTEKKIEQFKEMAAKTRSELAGLAKRPKRKL